MVDELIEAGVVIFNILLCIIIIGYIKKQKLKRNPLLKNSFYGFYLAMLLYFSAHFVRDFYFEAYGRLAWKLEATGGILAAWIFGNLILTLKYSEIASSIQLIERYLKDPPLLHAIYTFIMFVGIAVTWTLETFDAGQPSKTVFKEWYLVYIIVILFSAITIPTFYALRYSSGGSKAETGNVYLERFKIIVISYLFLVLTINTAYILTWFTHIKDLEVIGYILASFPLALMAFALREPKLLQEFTFEKPEVDGKTSVEEYQSALGKSALILYVPRAHYENAAIEIIANYLSLGKNVVLVTQAPRAKMYFERLEYFVTKDMIKLVEITTESTLIKSPMFSVKGLEEKDAYEDAGSLPVSINNLEYLTEIAEHMPRDSVLIFEALTGVILGLGENESVYKFFTGIVERMSAKNRTLVAFINSEGHEKEVVSSYEGLFINILKIEGDFIVTLKGEKKRIPIKNLSKE